MNISTGGPHILLFERDQQLAGLLVSEFQLAGYECHTARTAVEVFDAIARQPIRLVLVNLAQAAAARREFWVALETQRRGRGVQVLTFRCNNIAGYSSQDFEDRAHMATADVEVDGMLGVMNLVDAVRARVPLLATSTNTMPRMPRTATPMPSMAVQQRPVQTPQPTMNTNGILSASGTSSRSLTPDDAMQSSPRGSGILSQAGTNTQASQQMPAYQPLQAQTAPAYQQPQTPTYQPSQAQMPPTYQAPQAMPAQSYQTQPVQMTPTYQTPAGDMSGINANQASYTDKIRAVLYPNQRSWTPQGGNTSPVSPDIRELYDPQNVVASSQPLQTSSPEVSMLQHLAGNQAMPESPGESGLAQLSRMVQERQSGTQTPEREQSSRDSGVYRYADPLQTEAPIQPIRGTASQANSSGEMSRIANTRGFTQPASAPSNEPINTQPLRAAPIEDMPVERATGGQEGNRRPDVLSRANYGQQPPVAMPPLASISSQPAAAPVSPQPVTLRGTVMPQRPVQEEIVVEQASPAKITPATRSIEEQATDVEKERKAHRVTDLQREGILKAAEVLSDHDLSTSPDNAVILDIVQSLPPMPPVNPQALPAAQPQVLNGRATRTLGSVLLEGHLVPQNRLEVAQHVQRMLRGVDLNYQLGEILLMFKLLTPDQLLAASLVSYGLITTTQISALGRIRQELHAIGLEYDLENLLVLFRILTSEQLREVRASWQS
jgi:hypothetical protein